MAFLNLPWLWEHDEFGKAVPVPLHISRWRRGPVTFYRYRLHLMDHIVLTQYWLCFADDFEIGVHLPGWLQKRLGLK